MCRPYVLRLAFNSNWGRLPLAACWQCSFNPDYTFPNLRPLSKYETLSNNSRRSCRWYCLRRVGICLHRVLLQSRSRCMVGLQSVMRPAVAHHGIRPCGSSNCTLPTIFPAGARDRRLSCGIRRGATNSPNHIDDPRTKTTTRCTRQIRQIQTSDDPVWRIFRMRHCKFFHCIASS